MPSTSKSNKQEPKQQWQAKEPTRNWLELPEDIMANILYRVGVFDILENAQKVCTTWRKICKEPAMWRVIFIAYMDARPPLSDVNKFIAMFKHVVDRSQGQLIDITIVDFCFEELLLYVADRSIQLRRLEMTCCHYSRLYGSWTEALKKFPLLEELSLYSIDISKEAIETVGRYCPMLKKMKLNQEGYTFWNGDTDEEPIMNRDEIAIAIGQNLHELEHLELIGNSMSNIGLQVILDGCHHLKLLDLRECLYIDLERDLGKRCSEQIKWLKLPNDSLECHSDIHDNDYPKFDDSDDEYYGSFKYDDSIAYADYDDDLTAYDDYDDVLNHSDDLTAYYDYL